MLKALQEQSRWLSRYASDVTSQFGEDGIIAKALSLLPQRTSWCVEFGAWDGKHYSNTYNLVQSHNYRGVFIEPDPVKFRDLLRTHGASGRNVLINSFVGFTRSDCLDVLLSRCDIPKEFDFLSIDIDGNDYYTWEALEEYRPKLVLIEFNGTLSNSALFVQRKKQGVTHGSSPASLVELACRKGYQLVACTSTNLLFVVAEHFGAFDIADNSLAVMRDDSDVPQIFVGYDGHVFLSQASRLGSIALPWHNELELKEAGVQALPRLLQKHPGQYTLLEKWLFRLTFSLKHPRRALHRLLRPQKGQNPLR